MGNSDNEVKELSVAARNQRGVLTQDVRLLSGGFTRRAGTSIARGEVDEAVWQLWLEEGIIELPSFTPVNPRVLARNRRKAGKDKVIE